MWGCSNYRLSEKLIPMVSKFTRLLEQKNRATCTNNQISEEKKRHTLCLLCLRMQKVVQRGSNHSVYIQEVVLAPSMQLLNGDELKICWPRKPRFPSAQILEDIGGLLVAHCRHMNFSYSESKETTHSE